MDGDCPVFQFRGERDYLHSSTMFDHLLTLDDAPSEIDFAVHRMTGNQCRIINAKEVDGRPLDEKQPVATYRSGGIEKVLVERETPLESSYPCNESEICAAATRIDNSMQFEMPPIPDASYIEAVVGVYKHLLQSGVEAIPGKLVFARMTLTHVPSSGTCRVEHRRAIKGGYYQATLYHDDQVIGKLVFGLV